MDRIIKQEPQDDCYVALATAIICTAYADLLRYRLLIESVVEPERNKTSKRFHKLAQREIIRNASSAKKPITKREYDATYKKCRMSYVKRKEYDIEAIERFFHSELFDLYSSGADGDYFIKMADKEMEEYYAGRTVRIPNTTYVSANDEHKIGGRFKFY